jgi:hypothetical protein
MHQLVSLILSWGTHFHMVHIQLLEVTIAVYSYVLLYKWFPLPKSHPPAPTPSFD